jgi:hypothetical protein
MLSTMVELPQTFAVLADIQLQGRGTQVGAFVIVVCVDRSIDIGCDPIFSANRYRLLHSFLHTHTHTHRDEVGSGGSKQQMTVRQQL